MRPPLPCQPFALELLDPMGGDFVQDERAQGSIQRLQDFPITINAPLLLLRVVLEVGRGELLKRNVGLLPDAAWRPSKIRDRSRASIFLASCLFAVSVVFR